MTAARIKILTLTLILIGEGLEVVRDGGTDQHVSLNHLANDPFGVLSETQPVPWCDRLHLIRVRVKLACVP